jgi:hypothetical protein
MKPELNSTGLLETELRRSTPNGAVPPDLHDSILGAVRAAAPSPQREPTRLLWRGLAAPGLALLAVGGLWWALSRPAGPAPPLLAAARTLEEGQALPQTVSAAMLAPLSQEMEFVDRDLRNTVEFLLASVP